MRFRGLAVVVAVVSLAACGGSNEKERVDDDGGFDKWTPLLERLNAIDGVTARQLGQYTDGSIVFDMMVRQPVDHAVPDGATFEQRVVLRFSGRYDRPVVLLTDGYEIQYFNEETKYIYFTEPTVMFNATQIEVEHRYYGSSLPAEMDWSKLTVEQAAADHHRIHELLAGTFEGAWLSTGVSKSGMSALFYRYLYPDDVIATVAYVAPLMQATGDARFAAQLASVGSPLCRDKLSQFQRLVLDATPRTELPSRRAVMVQRVTDLFGLSSLTRLGADLAFEQAVIAMPFTFWQYLEPSLCDDVPGDSATDDQLFAFLGVATPMGGFTDARLQEAQPFRYQSYTQLGTPLANVDAIDDLLLHAAEDIAPRILPATVIPAFDPTLMQAVAAWAGTTSERVMLVYGEYDPWTAGAIDLGVGRATRSYVVAQGNHGAHIAELADADRSNADATLAEWTGFTVDTRYRNGLTLQMPHRWDLQLQPW